VVWRVRRNGLPAREPVPILDSAGTGADSSAYARPAMVAEAPGAGSGRCEERFDG
jgi:hypothetical protein